MIGQLEFSSIMAVEAGKSIIQKECKGCSVSSSPVMQVMLYQEVMMPTLGFGRLKHQNNWEFSSQENRRKYEYLEAVKNLYKHLPEVKRIVRHRHLPKPIYKAAALRRTMMEAERRKTERRKTHSAPGSIVTEPLRKRRIIKEIEYSIGGICLREAVSLHGSSIIQINRDPSSSKLLINAWPCMPWLAVLSDSPVAILSCSDLIRMCNNFDCGPDPFL